MAVPMVEYLRSHFEKFKIYEEPDLPSFAGGAIGNFGFSCAGWFEKTLKKPSEDAKDAALMFYRSIVAFDHAKQVIKIISLVFTGEGEPDELYRNACVTNKEIKELLETGFNGSTHSANSKEKYPVISNWTQTEFESAVLKIKELILAGECYQVVLSQCFSRQTTASPVAIYRAIRSVNPSPYMFLLKMGEKAIIGASPEMLVRCRGRSLEYRPIAGTRKRGTTPGVDAALAEEMRLDKKEVGRAPYARRSWP